MLRLGLGFGSRFGVGFGFGCGYGQSWDPDPFMLRVSVRLRPWPWVGPRLVVRVTVRTMVMIVSVRGWAGVRVVHPGHVRVTIGTKVRAKVRVGSSDG